MSQSTDRQGSPRLPGTALIVSHDIGTFARFRDHLVSQPNGFAIQQTSMIDTALARMGRDCDVAIVDLDLPEANGRALLHRIRAAASELPIVLLVDDFDPSILSEALRLGIQDCLKRHETDTALVNRTVQAALLRGRRLVELKAAQEREHHAATHDPLTLLSNRNGFTRSLDVAIASASRRTSKIALLFCDLDRFKAVNDRFGHAEGDAVLAEVGARMRRITRRSDLLARLGGDEFVVALNDADMPRAVMRAAEQFIASISAPIAVNGHEHFVSISIGAAVYPDDAQTAAELIRAADLAMYNAKRTQGSCIRFYQDEMDREIRARFALVADVRAATRRNEYFLEYQPQLDVHEQRLVGAEALLRWQHPERGRMAPLEFLGIAEDTGMILEIGRFVLREACEQAAQWGVGASAPTISVNVSRFQLFGGFANDVRAALAESRLAPGRLVLEMTEQSMDDRTGHTRAVLDEVAALGVKVAVDRFGVGAGSLTLLQWPSIRILKIDRSLAHDVDRNPRSCQIVSGLLSLARRLDLEVIAEGVERREQIPALRALGCTRMQGFALGAPISSKQFAHGVAHEDEAPWRVDRRSDAGE